MNWEKILHKIANYKDIKTAKRAFIWGMAIHELTDAFSHSVFVDGKYVAHGGIRDENSPPHNKESNEYAGKDRYKAAKEATDLALNVYRDTSYVSGTYNQFSPVRLYSTFKMINIYDYIKEEADATIASTYNSHNQKISVE